MKLFNWTALTALVQVGIDADNNLSMRAKNIDISQRDNL